MCYKCWLECDGANTLGTGLLAVKGKNYDKIVAKIRSLRKRLAPAVAFGMTLFNKAEEAQLLDLLGGMLALDPSERLTPAEVLEHRFLQ